MKPQSLAALCTIFVSCIAVAFPVYFVARVDVDPLAPTPQDNVVITVHNTFDGTLSLLTESMESVATAIDGNVIAISGKWGNRSGFSFEPLEGFQVNLGRLPLGRYTVSYSSDSQTNPTFHNATLEFTVSRDGFGTAVEFFNGALGHYFITAFPDEIAKLDQGIIRGWVRTGESFRVIPADAIPSTAQPVCRFYGLPSAGLDSHFFTSSGTECADVQKKWPGQWQLETTNAFGVRADGVSCPVGAVPLFRLYNNRAGANHRYTTSRQTRDAMVAQGWVAEGSGPDGMAMCLPS